MRADAPGWKSPLPQDAVICSYALTMMPCWREVIDRLPALARASWPRWFAHAGVHAHADLAPSLLNIMQPDLWIDADGPLPWLPLLRAPYLVAVGPSSRGLHMPRINPASTAPPSAPVTELQ